MGRNQTLLQKGLLLIAVPVVFQLAFIAALFKMQRESVDAEYWAIHTQQVIVQTEMVLRTMLEGINSSRGYVITGNPIFADAVRRAIEQTEAEIDELYQFVQDNQKQQKLVEAIDDNCEVLIRWLQRVNQLLEDNQRDQAIVEIKRLYGKQRFDALREATDRFVVQERNLDVVRRDNLERSWQIHNGLLISGLLIMLLVAISMLVLFYRSISHRMALLAEKARLLGEGEPLTAPLAGNDEIARLDRHFHEMAKALADRNKENELFVYSASHDLRSRLAQLRKFGEQLKNSIGEIERMLKASELPTAAKARGEALLSGTIPEELEAIQIAALRMGVTIDSLLRLSRAGRIEYHWQTLELQSTIEHVLASLAELVSQPGVQVSVKPLPAVWGDRAAIEQLFTQLISNAVYYRDAERPCRIEISVLDAKNSGGQSQYTFCVKDNGLGVPKDCQPKLFLAFQRFHPEIRHGDGIGLALVRRIVDRHGGSVWATSTTGVGTAIYFTLPGARSVSMPTVKNGDHRAEQEGARGIPLAVGHSA